MCGIFALIGNPTGLNDVDYKNIEKHIKHRGPDHTGFIKEQLFSMVHTRLSINGIGNGSQPIVNDDIYLCVNGEIYNHMNLKSNHFFGKYKFATDSDCEVIIPLYRKFGKECVKMLDGIFTFVLFDKRNSTVLVARDRIGINSLYYGEDTFKNVIVSSQAQALLGRVADIKMFPSGTVYQYTFNDVYQPKLDVIDKYYSVDSFYTLPMVTDSDIYTKIKNSLVKSVYKRLMTEVPFGVLLSGGLDSSLVASITAKLTNEKINTFSIGLQGAPDLKYARIVADHIKSNHHEFHFTVEEGIACLNDIVRHLETYDVTTIRASIPMYLLSKKIREKGIKMVLSGEGADEILGGYLYFHQAPNDVEFHRECVKRLNDLPYFDCLRANKSTMAWGIEARVPFLDRDFIETSLCIDPKIKLKDGIEKHVLRNAFTTDNYLPDSILWRQKEQFSDGVGYNWIDSIKSFAEHNCRKKHENMTLEESYYYDIYTSIFGQNNDHFVRRWIPRTQWDGVSYDPSGRAQKTHIDKKEL
jgi:asparagine synthase (glutamine-hydrolysing)